jgi:NAD(P)-dependent dehydrogenase (short-subunit alcohol dehydrogenase family)
MKSLNLEEKVAVITGSSRGIGRSIAEHLAAAGAKVVISSRKADACEKVAESISNSGGEAISVPANISDKSQLENLVAATHKKWGRVDIRRCDAQEMGACRHPRLQCSVQPVLRPDGRYAGRSV